MLIEPKCISCKYFNSDIIYKNSCKNYNEIPNNIYENMKQCEEYKKIQKKAN